MENVALHILAQPVGLVLLLTRCTLIASYLHDEISRHSIRNIRYRAFLWVNACLSES